MSSSQLPSTRSFVTQLVDALGAARAGTEHDAAPAHTGTNNPLEGVGAEVRKQMLALHVVFPNELLPALDLLDRSLVTRLRVRRSNEDSLTEAAPQGVRGQTGGLHAQGAQGSSNIDGRIATAASTRPPHPDVLGQTESSDAEMLDAPPRSELTVDIAHNSPRDTPTDTVLDTVFYVRSAQQRSSRYSTSFDTLTSYEVRLNAWNCSCPAFAFSAFPPVHPEPPVSMYEVGSETKGDGAWTFGGATLGEDPAPACKHLLACVLAERCSGLFGDRVEERVVSLEEAAGWAAGWGD